MKKKKKKKHLSSPVPHNKLSGYGGEKIAVITTSEKNIIKFS